MTRIIDSDSPPELTFRQRWASYLTLLVALFGILGGMLARSNVVNATYPFSKPEVGILARYPAQWLLEEGSTTAFVFRATDPASTPFKTSLQITLIPTGTGARPADILYLLDMDRAARLAAYRSLERIQVDLPGGKRGTQMTYAYASVGTDPFLQTEPITVRAVDIVVLRSGQAVVITYESAADSFEHNYHYFDAFLRSLSF
jgi:hypothetical protein